MAIYGYLINYYYYYSTNTFMLNDLISFYLKHLPSHTHTQRERKRERGREGEKEREGV